MVTTAQGWTVSADFESGVDGAQAVGTSGYNGGDTGTTTTFSNQQAHGGSMSSRFAWVVGDTGYSTNTGHISYPSDIPAGGEVWLRAYYYFDTGWLWNGEGTKIYRNHNRHLDLTHAKYTSIFTRSGAISLSIEPSPEDLEAASAVNFDIGSWQCIELYVKLGSNNDGITRIWKDGVLIYETTTYSTSEVLTDTSDFAYIFSTWNLGPPQNQYSYVDDVIVSSDTPINVDAAGNKMIGPDDWTGTIHRSMGTRQGTGSFR